MVTQFPCKQCGKCCTMLDKGEWTGISLFPWETQLFPEKDIKPSLGLGNNHEKIILYSYIVSECTHLEDGKCTIYTTRPLVCRSYPFRVTNQGDKTIYIVAPECTAVQEWPEKTAIEERYVEMDAAELIGDHLSRFYKASEPKWRYKMDKGWKRIGRDKTRE